jgi:IS5 family transposase
MEKQLNFNLLFMKFCELSTTDRKPDHSTISKWRDRFIKDNIHDKLFSEINRQFEELGLIMKYGSVIDATIISSQARPRRKQLVINEDPEENVDLDQNHDNEDTEKEIETKEQQIVFEESKDPDARYLVKRKKIHYESFELESRQ